MAEIVGVAASATQLCTACFSLIDILKKIKGGASTLKRYHEHLQELQNISTCISQNPLLQTPEIGTQTRALLSTIENNCINSLLAKGRLLRTWGFLYREQDLLETFVTLERQKSNLSLAIEQIQSKALYQIQNDIQIMADRKPQNASSTGASSGAEQGAFVSPNSSAPRSPVQTPAGLLELNRYIQAHFASLPKIESSQNRSSTNRQASTSSSNSQFCPVRDQINGSNSRSTTGPQWNNPVAGPGFEQQNGRQYFANGPAARELFTNRSKHGNQNPVTINNPLSIGRGDQYNQNVVEYSGDPSGVTEPDMSGDVWNNPQVLPWLPTDPGAGHIGKQVNGYVIRYKGPSGDTQED